MLRKPEQELASAKLLGGAAGFNGKIEIAEGVDKRLLLMLCDNLVEVLERSGYMTPEIVQARTLIQAQLKEWGFKQPPAGPSPNGLPT